MIRYSPSTQVSKFRTPDHLLQARSKCPSLTQGTYSDTAEQEMTVTMPL